ncbi:hypothetical protein PDESU_06486 [Pontiella desulfatans]|uniref:HEAT repeat domain-containing protein n=1 Tax=Pontiella desulfatans TaxID=2750659 RepID=A0A6C2UET7_PONDE|nr:HEAT repeat domain-containing protein [Pontiella desulfatans]VGO17884.1 hypothetical protein PDESU_06486 [Pontiella desulfatans]
MKERIVQAGIAIALLLGVAGCGETTVETIAKWKTEGNTEKLITAFGNPQQDIRIASIEAVADLKAKDAIGPLAGLLNDPDLVIVHEAIEAIAAIGGDAAIPHMVKLLNYETARARLTAAKALGEWKVSGAVDALIGLLDDEHLTVGCAAAQSLGQIGSPKAIDPLAAQLKKRSFDIRFASVAAIGQIGGDEAAAALAPAIGDFSEKIRIAVIETMVGIGEPSVPFALKALRSKGEFTRPAAAAILKGTGKEPTTGNDLVWYTLAKIPQDPKAEVDPALVAELVALDNNIDGLLEAAVHPTPAEYEYAVQALETIGEPAAAPATAAVGKLSDNAPKSWFAGRSNWSGAPSWRLDLWGAITALNPRFSLNPLQAQTLATFEADARSLMNSSKFKPSPEYIPLLIAQTKTPPEFSNREKSKNAKQNIPLAEKNLILIGDKAFNPLVAGLDAEDISIASSCAKVLLQINREQAKEHLLAAFTAKAEAGAEITGSEFLDLVIALDDPSVAPLLAKVRPSDARAIQVFNEKFPEVQVSVIPMPPADPHPTAEPFKLKYVKSGHTKELRVIFRKGETGEWAPEPPLPDSLP